MTSRTFTYALASELYGRKGGETISVYHYESDSDIIGELESCFQVRIAGEPHMRIDMILSGNRRKTFYVRPAANVVIFDTTNPKEKPMTTIISAAGLTAALIGRRVEVIDIDGRYVGELRELRATKDYVQVELTLDDGKMTGFRLEHRDDVKVIGR